MGTLEKKALDNKIMNRALSLIQTLQKSINEDSECRERVEITDGGGAESPDRGDGESNGTKDAVESNDDKNVHTPP